MPRERLSMRKIKEVLRLRWEAGRSQREIAVSCRLGPTTVRDYLVRIETRHPLRRSPPAPALHPVFGSGED